MKSNCLTASTFLLALAGSACSSPAQNLPADASGKTDDQMARTINESIAFQSGAIKGMEFSISRQLGADALKCMSPTVQEAMRSHFSTAVTTSLNHSEILEGYEIAVPLKATDLNRYVNEHFDTLYQRANQKEGNVSHAILRSAASELHFSTSEQKNVEKLISWDEKYSRKVGPQLQTMEPALTREISRIAAGCGTKKQ